MTENSCLNVVVVGLGLAGAGAANELAKTLPSNYRVIGITANEAAFYSVASLRGAVVPGWEEKVTLPLENLFQAGSRHILLKGTKVAKLENNAVVLDRVPDGFVGLDPKTRIPFDYCILAMGSSYPVPCRPLPGETSREKVAYNLQGLQQSVAASTSVLVIGGGPVGIEFAGEVKSLFPSKQVTLTHSRPSLMDDFKPSLGKSLLDQLTNTGVKVIFDCKLDATGLDTGLIDKRTFDLGTGKGSIDADFVFIAFGNAPVTSLVEDWLPEALDAKRVRVKPSLQVDVEGFEHVFAVGDITNIKETKLWYHAQSHGPVAAANIVSLIAQKPPSKMYSAGQKLIVISVGPSGGASQLFYGVVVGAWATAMAKSKTLFYSKFQSTYHA